MEVDCAQPLKQRNSNDSRLQMTGNKYSMSFTRFSSSSCNGEELNGCASMAANLPRACLLVVDLRLDKRADLIVAMDRWGKRWDSLALESCQFLY